MESVLQKEKRCFLCGKLGDLEKHHCIHGYANRKIADKYGLWVWLCTDCHRGNDGVHLNRTKDLYLIQLAQKWFEEHIGGRDLFRKVFGKSWL